MTRQTLACFNVVVAIVGPAGLIAAAEAAGPMVSQPADMPSTAPTFDYHHWATVLKTCVQEDGMVDYARLKSAPQALDAFLEAVASLDHDLPGTWPERERIAFWMNAYNAAVLKIVVEHHPAGLPRLRKEYPARSIHQIPGVWDKLRVAIASRRLTLNEIENEILRKEFHEPRIHLALVCAAKGCPPLRREPYTGARLDAQLDHQVRRFLGDPAKFRIDRDGSTIYLSPIFKWFGQDFAAWAAPGSGNSPQPPERAVVRFICGYLSQADRAYLSSPARAVRYLEYDWTLNEARSHP